MNDPWDNMTINLDDIDDTTDTIVLADPFRFDDNDTITITDPLSTSLTNGYTYNYPATTISAAGIATAGATLSTTNVGGLLWNNNTTYPNTVNTNWTTYNQPQVLKVSGDAEFEGDIKIKGVSLDERFKAIEERLGILRPNEGLEDKWEKLKKLGDEYRQLEKEILEGESIWNMLKK